MSDNSLQGGSDIIRDIDKGGGVKTQVFVVDKGGAGAESLVTDANPYPVKDEASGNFLWRILQLLSAPLGYDKSLQRARVTAAVETLPTLANVTTLGTVTNAVPVGNIATIDGRNAAMLVNAQSRVSWALNVRSRIS